MTLSRNFRANNQNSSTFFENTSQNLEQIYDKYAPVIYQIINSLTDNVAISERIFTDTILRIKDDVLGFNMNGTVYPNLMRFTYSFAVQELIHYGIIPKINNSNQNNKLTYLRCTCFKSLQEAASLLSIPYEEVRKRLRQEYLEFNQ